MSRIRSTNTQPELTVRKFLFGEGLRYRVNYELPGTPDIVFPSRKIAVFVHGCFWHRHDCSRSTMPKSNTKYWKEKLERNVKRDREAVKQLKKSGWTSLVVWECELNRDREKILRKLLLQVNRG